MTIAKRLIALLPASWQEELKRVHYRRQVARGAFVSDEPEFALLDRFLSRGDWVIDIGANVGHYTCRFSDLVGPTGRVVAMEPVPETFALLAANARWFRWRNVTLVNAAASDKAAVGSMVVPRFETGLKNFYQAQLTAKSESDDGLGVFCLPLDGLQIPGPVRLIKVDAEGHEPQVLRGAMSLIRASRPTLIIEGRAPEVHETLATAGYRAEVLVGSPNTLFHPY